MLQVWTAEKPHPQEEVREAYLIFPLSLEFENFIENCHPE